MRQSIQAAAPEEGRRRAVPSESRALRSGLRRLCERHAVPPGSKGTPVRLDEIQDGLYGTAWTMPYSISVRFWTYTSPA